MQDMHSTCDRPRVAKMSLIKGVVVFLLTTLELRKRKSTTNLLSVVSFRLINMTGEVWLVLFLDKIPKCTSLSICQSIHSLSSSAIPKGSDKEWAFVMYLNVNADFGTLSNFVSEGKGVSVLSCT